MLGAIEHDLKAGGCPPLAWYDVLLELSRAAGGACGRSRSRRRRCSRSTISRACSTGSKRRVWSTREPCEDDARGQWVVITEKGRATQARTWKVYAKSIQKHVGEKLDDKAAAALADLLGRLTT